MPRGRSKASASCSTEPPALSVTSRDPSLAVAHAPRNGRGLVIPFLLPPTPTARNATPPLKHGGGALFEPTNTLCNHPPYSATRSVRIAAHSGTPAPPPPPSCIHRRAVPHSLDPPAATPRSPSPMRRAAGAGSLSASTPIARNTAFTGPTGPFPDQPPPLVGHRAHSATDAVLPPPSSSHARPPCAMPRGRSAAAATHSWDQPEPSATSRHPLLAVAHMPRCARGLAVAFLILPTPIARTAMPPLKSGSVLLNGPTGTVADQP